MDLALESLPDPDTLPHPGRRFLGDTGSLKSVGRRRLTSAASSLKAMSLKSKNPLKMPTLRRRRARSSDFDRSIIKDKDFNTPLPPKPLVARKSEDNMSRTRASNQGAANDVQNQINSEGPRKTTRSKTIMRLISTTFRPRSPQDRSPPRSPPFARSPPPITSAFGSKETREAALRERGLLPPLKPNMDLSLAERQRDNRLPILTPPTTEEEIIVNGEGRKATAASLIKQEWEARNVQTIHEKEDLERMKNFTFGGLAPFPVMEEGLAPTTTPHPILAVEPVDPPSPIRPENLPLPATPPLSIRSKRLLPALVVPSDETTGLQLPSEPHLIPLPPSPRITSPRSKEELDSILLAASFPLPPSPQPTALQRSPTISLTPPIVPHTVRIPLYGRADSSSSVTTPLSDKVSPLTVSILDTLDTSIREHDVVPVIIESPIEEQSLFETALTRRARESDEVQDFVQDEPDGSAKPPNVTVLADPSVPKPRLRNVTDPGLKAHQAEARKSFNPFKRNQASPEREREPVVDTPTPTSMPRRLSMGASLSNMRRSIVGTLSRPTLKSPGLGVKAAKGGFDASHLPPSPTVPARFVDQFGGTSPTSPKWSSPFAQQQQQRPLPPDLKPRIPVSPTLYSMPTIVAETSNIEDDETRRMTELAFLG
ncbi:hypothetical protein H0H92_009406 [Tricholoma furcatifolium]|nr:hypothetical protein H0H92_009406 [Tricholoma furcatifolium]